MKLDDAFHTRRIRSIIGHEPPRPNEYPFMYGVGDAYRGPDRPEPVGTKLLTSKRTLSCAVS